MPNYLQLNMLQTKYGTAGFQILGFPCAQFDNQEPGDNDEILNCLAYVRPGGGFKPNFPLFAKSTVNGEGTIPPYVWLKSQCPPTTTIIDTLMSISWSPVSIVDIPWNFEKFLISRDGHVYKRYSGGTQPTALESDIEYLLSAS